MIVLEALCDSVTRIPQPGKAEPTYQAHFTVVDTPANRQYFGTGGPRGEAVLIGLVESAYTFDQVHKIQFGSNSEAPAADQAPGRPGP